MNPSLEMLKANSAKKLGHNLEATSEPEENAVHEEMNGVATEGETVEVSEAEHLEEHEEEHEEDHEDDCHIKSFEDFENFLVSHNGKHDEKSWEILIDTQDKASLAIEQGNCKEPLKILEKFEKILEFVATSGKPIDRNLVIVILHNVACAYQGLWILDKCSTYADGVIYNIKESILQDDDTLKTLTSSNAEDDASAEEAQNILAVRLRKKYFLVKAYLQHCAVLSQLGNHVQALKYAQESAAVMISVFEDCLDYAEGVNHQLELYHHHHNLQPKSHHLPTENENNLEAGEQMHPEHKNSDRFACLKEEADFFHNLLEYAVPFLRDVTKSLSKFQTEGSSKLLLAAKKSFFNWKTVQENNEKYFRKEFKKGDIPEEVNNKRNILGVEHKIEWLENLNIGAMMHMKPTQYKDYASKRDLSYEITREHLQEKLIYLSLAFFTIATEMRFTEVFKLTNAVSDKANIKEEVKETEGYKQSESYHLKSIELVCRYINEECPFINHLIQSYQKHYSENLDAIPEESFISTNHQSENVHKDLSVQAEEENEDEEVKITLEDSTEPNTEPPMRHSSKEGNLKKASFTEDVFLNTQKQEAVFQKRASLDQNPTQKLTEASKATMKGVRRETKSTQMLPKTKSGQNFYASPRSIEKNSLQDIISSIDREKIKNLLLSQDRQQKALSPQRSMNNADPLSRNVHKISKSQVTKPKTSESANRGSDLQKHLYIQNEKLKANSKLEGPHRLKSSPRDSQNINIGRYIKTEGNQQPKRSHQSPDSLKEKNLLAGSNINVYFYKNFNKYIQNLYIKEEQNHQNVKNNNPQRLKGNRDKYAPYKPDKFFKKSLQLNAKKGAPPVEHQDYRSYEKLRVNTEPSTNQFSDLDFASDVASRQSKEFPRNSPRNHLASGGNPAKILAKSTSLQLFQSVRDKKPANFNSSQKQQFFSPRVGEY